MSLTITIPGAVEATTGAVAPATLTIGVGTPGATGPAGPAGAAGVGVPAGGTAGQFLTKIDGTNYNTDWTTVNLSSYAPLASPAFTGNPTAPTATFGDNNTSISTTAFVQAALAGGTAVAKNLEVYVRNQSGSTIAAGSIVYISGATGNRPLITLAQANNDANSAQTIGFVKTSIANNGFGNVIVRGELENIDTSALTEGAQLYLSPTTAGTWTTTKPSAPQHLVYVGIVLRSHPTLGVILVAVQNGYELGEIHDVALSSPADNDLLAYESATDLWKNKSFSTLGLATTASLSGYAQLSGATFTGEVSTPASTTSSAGLSILPGTAPSAPTNGEIWNTGSDLQVQIGGVTETVAEQSWVSTNYAAKSGATFTGLLTTVASTTTTAGLNLPHGTAPTTPVNGDLWTTTGGLFWRQNGTTYQAMNLFGTQTVSGNITFSNASLTLGNSTAAATYNLGTGATLTATTKAINIGTNGVSGSTTNIAIGSTTGTNAVTINGPTTLAGTLTASGATITVGNTTAASTVNIGTGATLTATTKAVNIGTGGVAGSTTNIAIGTVSGGTSTTTMNGTTTFAGPITAVINNISLGSGTGAQVMDFATGVTATGLTKAVSIGTGGAAGSTTTIAIGGTAGTSTTTLNGTTNGVTPAADTNSTALATTAYVVGQASATSPANDAATATTGTSLKYARADHAHLNPLPSGGTTGQVLSKIDGTNYNVQWTTSSGGGSSTDFQAYTTAGTFTWTKPANAKWVEIYLWGGGGGGGSGSRYATATAQRAGGGGGSSSSPLFMRVPASVLGATESVVVGAGGTGGAPSTVNDTPGNIGSAGGHTTFSNFFSKSGNGGQGGTNTSSTPGGTASNAWFLGTISTGSGPGGNGAPTTGGTAAASTGYTSWIATGGGGGAGAQASTSPAPGGPGGLKTQGTTTSGLVSAIAGGAGGTTAGVLPIPGISSNTLSGGGTGGGGGAYITAVAGMAGAVGGFPAGGGGGGAASDNGFASGAGGAGAVGAAYIITYC